MKTFSFFMLTLLFALSVNAQTAVAVAEKSIAPAISWDQTTSEFGEIEQNKPVTAEFVLTNNSDQPLLLTNVKSTCGCTVPKYQEEPILPGEQTTIKATYNAKKEGAFVKTVKVFTSLNDQPIPLTLKGKVVKDLTKQK